MNCSMAGIADSVMNFKCTVVIALLLAHIACNNEFHTQDGEQSQNLPRLALREDLPTCGACVITSDTPIQGLLAALKDFGPGMTRASYIASSIFRLSIKNVKDMQAHIKKMLEDLKVLLLTLFGKVFTAAANLDVCPAFKTALNNLKTNIDALFTDYIQNWPTFVTGVNTSSIIDAYRKALATSLPKMFVLFRDLIYGAIQLSGSSTCEEIGPVFNLLTDPNEVAMQQIVKFLNDGGSVATDYVELLAGGFMPAGEKGGTLDQFETLKQSFCGLLSTALGNSGLKRLTGGYCSSMPVDPLDEAFSLVCAFLYVIDQDESNESCTAESAGGEDSDQQGLLDGLLCGVLGLLGLCSAGGPTLVQTYTALVCRAFKTLGGVGLSICDSS